MVPDDVFFICCKELYCEIVCVLHHRDHRLIPALRSYLIEVTSVTCQKSVVHFDSTKY